MAEGYIKGQPDVSFWLGQIRKGIAFRKTLAREAEWETWRNYYRGVWQPDTLPSALYFKMLRTIVPRVYFRNPSISISSAKPGFENLAFAQILQQVDNKLLRAMRVKKQIKKIVQNTFMFGTGCGKLGYGAQFTLVPDVGETTDPVKGGERFEYHSLVKANMPWFLSVHPGKLIVPAGLEDYDDSRWTAMWVQRPLADVKGDPRFKNAKDLKPSARGIEPGMDVHRSSKTRAKPVDMIDLVEVRDKKTGKVFVFAPYSSGTKTLYNEEDDLFINGRHTFYPVVFNQDDVSFWGVPDSVHVEPGQREINEIKTQQMKHRRMSIVKLLAKRNGILPAEAEKMISETVEPVVWVEDDVDKAVKVIEAAHIPKDLYLAEEAVMRDQRESVGFSRNEFGEFNPGSSDTTAFEASVVKQASEIRIDERRDMVADMLVDMVTDMHTIIFEQWTQEQVINIAGPRGIQLWVKFSGEILKQGSYEVNIDPDSSVPETKQVREAKAVQIYTLLRENQAIDQNLLTKFLLSEMDKVGLQDLMSGVPEGQGLAEGQPMNPEQLGQILQNAVGSQGKGNT